MKLLLKTFYYMKIKLMKAKILYTFLVFLSFSNFVFASEDSWAMWHMAYWLLNTLNLLWLPFSIIAWKLFTNDLVYWTFLHLDTILWKIWNFSKNLSLIMLWFILIVSIILLFLWKIKNIFTILLKLAIAWVLIPLSWMIIWYIVDLSTLLLISVWTFPFKIFTEQTMPKAKVNICTKIRVSWDLRDMRDIVECEDWWKKTMDMNWMIKKMNNLAWPLVYIWQSILFLDRNWWLLNKKEIQDKKESPTKSIALSLLIKLIVLWLFVTPVFVLIIIWIIRLFRLRIYICFSPLIILDQVFGWKVLWKKNQFKFSNMLWLIFQPVFIVFVLWIVLVFLSALRSIMVVDYSKNQVDPWLKQLWICEPNTFCIWDAKVINIWWDLAKDFLSNVWWFFWYIIFLLLVAIILFSLIKLASKSSEITSSLVDRTYRFASESFKAIPFIPTPYWSVWIWAVEKAISKSILRSDFDIKSWEQADNLINKIYSTMWVKTTDLTVWEKSHWINELKTIWSEQDLVQKLVYNIDKLVKSQKHDSMVITASPYFKETIYSYMKFLYNKWWSISTLSSLKLIEEKDWKKSFVSSPDKMFSNLEFRQFLTWLIEDIKKWKKFNNITFSLVLQQINPHSRSDKTTIPLNKW